MHSLTPCVARRPRKPCRLMTPANPRPLLVPVTSTRLISLNSSTVKVYLGHVGRSGCRTSRTPLRFGVDLAGMASLGLGGVLALLVVETELHGVIAVAILGPDQEHGARTAFQDGDRHRRAVLLVNLGHAELHRVVPLVSSRSVILRYAPCRQGSRYSAPRNAGFRFQVTWGSRSGFSEGRGQAFRRPWAPGLSLEQPSKA